MTTPRRSARPARRRSRLAGAALALVGAAAGLAACSSDPATDTTQTTAPSAPKSAGAASLNVFQFRVDNQSEQPTVPVKLCYAEITAGSCETHDVAKNHPTDAYIHGEIAGVVGKIPENVPAGTPTGVSYHLYNPAVGLPTFKAVSAKYATADYLKYSEAPNKSAFPADSGEVKEFSLEDNDYYYDFTVNGYELRINRKGDATANGDKVVWLTILKAPVIPISTPTTTTAAP